MSEFRLSFPASVIAGKQKLSANDILLLRMHSFPDGIQTSDDVITLLALNNSCPEKCPEWDTFFVEQLAHHIVHNQAPRGYVDAAKVGWMRSILAVDGIIASQLELDTMLHVLDLAPHVPPALSAFAVEQLCAALADGRGAYARRRQPLAGIGGDDIDYLQQVLRHALGRYSTGFAAEEIAVLERLDNIAAVLPNDPYWAAMLQQMLPQPRTPPKVRATGMADRWLKVSDSLFLEAVQPA
jgi:hypothetical protein